MSKIKDRPSIYIDEEIKFDYFKWLCDMVGVGEHWTLIRHLHRTPFRWTLTNDDNRAVDGQALRDRFTEECNYTEYEYPEDQCSVFEMLVGLAVRIDATLIDEDEGGGVFYWFWEMLSNLQLDKFTDKEFFDYGGIEHVTEILDVLLDRTYNRNGSGGLFPLKNKRKDQRKVEIWYQLSEYLIENHYIDDEI